MAKYGEGESWRGRTKLQLTEMEKAEYDPKYKSLSDAVIFSETQANNIICRMMHKASGFVGTVKQWLIANRMKP